MHKPAGDGRRSTGRSIFLIVPTYLSVILRIKLWTSTWNGGGGEGWGWGGGVVITACKCCEWCDLLWCETVKIKVLTLNFLSCCVKGWYRPYVVMQYCCMNEWRILVYLFAFILYFPMTKWWSFILFKINYYLLLLLIIINYYLLLKTLEITNSSCKLNQKRIGGAPADQRLAIKRWMAGDRRIHFRQAAIDRRPGGHLTMAWRWPPGHRQKILAIRQENWAVAEQSPGGDRHVAGGWFTTLFKVKKIGRRATDLEK